MNEAAKSSPADAIRFRLAEPVDVDALVRLINAAFRVELPFIEGDRTDAEGVRTYLAKGKFLVAEDSAGLAGCVISSFAGTAATWVCSASIRLARAPASVAS